MRIEHYEILYILPMSYTTEEVKPITQKVAELIKTNGGTIAKEQDLDKQKFAYPIKNQSHGYYFVYEFDLPTDKLAALNRILQLTSEVLRFIVVKKQIKSAEQIKEAARIQEKIAKKKEKAMVEEAKVEKVSKEKEKEKTKISLEDLDKKLDEILDDTKEML
ncbi:MAG: 30S ribosomal protein S6 [Patescibacteria group bacterium]|nr:30S ribosomal protein S6 [Patescibacteria group bacterium]